VFADLELANADGLPPAPLVTRWMLLTEKLKQREIAALLDIDRRSVQTHERPVSLVCGRSVVRFSKSVKQESDS
jgi:hypothetical protein